MHYKHVTHRRIGTYNRFPNRDTLCRLCAQSNESSVHLGTCPALNDIFVTIHHLTEYTPAYNPGTLPKTWFGVWGPGGQAF